MYNLLKPKPEMHETHAITVPPVKIKTSKKTKTTSKSQEKQSGSRMALASPDLMMSPSSHSEGFFSKYRDDESPKKPTSAFMMFCDQYKQSIQNDYYRVGILANFS